ncbi:hypothetical protein [Methylogaea oryzae]|uniref:Uncharacterized protein n=1 Tax=Methylogaea oryzae TaxID=1295382 RepID=A0A8D4VV10_9GAMM|nr:hypothetical protein [Methylogaea oryzae]BBL72760.1 hypothetical protein MoryE10_33660 [Methylogaea oryzae]
MFSDTLALDSQGYCTQIHDKHAQQTKHLIIGAARCHECGACEKPPLTADTIHIVDQDAEVEIKSRNLIVTENAKAYCLDHGVTITALPVLAA